MERVLDPDCQTTRGTIWQMIEPHHTMPKMYRTWHFAASQNQIHLRNFLVAQKILSSQKEAKRLIRQGGIKDNRRTVSDLDHYLVFDNQVSEHIILIGWKWVVIIKRG